MSLFSMNSMPKKNVTYYFHENMHIFAMEYILAVSLINWNIMSHFSIY